MPHNKYEIRAEERLLRYCARTIKNASPAYAEKITKALNPSLDWAYFLKRAHDEQLAPLIYKTLSYLGAAIPLSAAQKTQEGKIASSPGEKNRAPRNDTHSVIASPDEVGAKQSLRIDANTQSGAINRAPTRGRDTQAVCPPEIFEALKEAYYTTSSANILRLRQLEEIILTFNKENIPAIILKGPILAQTLYADLGLRQFSDLDVLVKERDLPAADRILRKLAYYTVFEAGDLGFCSFNSYRNSLFYLNRDKQKIPTHLYWHIINLITYNKSVERGINIGKIWEEALPLKLGEADAYTFSKPHQLIYLSTHALSHAFSPLMLLCDINEFLRIEEQNLDWQALVREARGFGLAKHLYYTLFFASEMLEAPAPETALADLRPKKMSLFERRFVSWALKGESLVSQEWMLYFGMNENFKDRIAFLCRVLFPHPRELAIIRQKEFSRIGLLDYAARCQAALNCAKKTIDKFLF